MGAVHSSEVHSGTCSFLFLTKKHSSATAAALLLKYHGATLEQLRPAFTTHPNTGFSLILFLMSNQGSYSTSQCPIMGFNVYVLSISMFNK